MSKRKYKKHYQGKKRLTGIWQRSSDRKGKLKNKIADICATISLYHPKFIGRVNKLAKDCEHKYTTKELTGIISQLKEAIGTAR